MKTLNIRLQSWRGFWLLLAALLVGAVLLWVGLALAIILSILAGAALLTARVRSLWSRKEAPRGPLTIEGRYSKTVD